MNPELKQKWVAALRSGDYVQGQEVLRGTNSDTGDHFYCCLGVLCDVAGGTFEEYGVRLPFDDADGGHVVEDEELDFYSLDYFGITSDQQVALIKMNDRAYENFDSIASYIEHEM